MDSTSTLAAAAAASAAAAVELQHVKFWLQNVRPHDHAVLIIIQDTFAQFAVTIQNTGGSSTGSCFSSQ